MPPAYPEELPCSTSLTPTSENRGLPQRKAPYYHSPSHVDPLKHPTGTTARLRQIRPLTVNEALQYSALSSIVPFDSSIIPIPTGTVSESQPLFTRPSEVDKARELVSQADVLFVKNHGQSADAQRIVQSLQASVCEYKFKAPPRLEANIRKLHASVGIGRPKTSSRLGRLANAIMLNGDVAFRYPTPSSPGGAKFEVHASPETVPPKIPITPQTPKHQFNEAAHTYNAGIPLSGDALQTPQRPHTQSIVVVPPLPDSFNPNDYRVFHGAPIVPGAKPSKKRKRNDVDEVDIAAPSKDQKALSDPAVIALQELISGILEAENDFEPSSNGTLTSSREPYFVSCEGADGTAITLSPTLNAKLESCLQKVISLGRFKEVPTEQLCKVQSLCEGALVSADSLDVSVHSGWAEDDISQWAKRVDLVDGSFRSARTVLRIMAGGREDKKIYSEELFKKVLDLLYRVMDTCVIPTVEARTSGAEDSIFDVASSCKKHMQQLLHNTGKLMQLLLALLTNVELAEDTVTSIEFFVIRVLFAENAHTEKESVLGIHRFEVIRRIAMQIIAQIFARYPEQRRFVLDEVLMSLQKLPVNRQRARQYKLDDGTSIQLVSALLMRLIHSSATRSASQSVKKSKRVFTDVKNASPPAASEIEEAITDDSTEASAESDDSETPLAGQRKANIKSIPQRLIKDVRCLYDSAVNNAQYIIEFFVTRASTSSKTGDQPHRHLLDMFVGDLVSVLHIPEWPASEILLRALYSKVERILNFDKSTAPAKNMALEVLGVVGTAILDVTANARQLSHALEHDSSELSTELAQSLNDHVNGHLEDQALLSWTGAYRVVVEYLGTSSSDSQVTGARGYYLTHWTKLILWGNTPTSTEPEVSPAHLDVAGKLSRIVSSGKWSSIDDFDSVTSSQCRLAYVLTILNMGFCRAFGQILQSLLKGVRSDQITVRSKSLKSVTQMLEKDPTLLERMPQVIRLIVNCASDQSTMVRDSSLALIGKCIILQPALELKILEPVLLLTNDSASSIRKRSMKLLKDIYLRNTSHKIRIEIAESLLQRVADLDESASDLAKQMLEDIWLVAFWTSTEGQDSSVEKRLSLKDQVILIIRTLQRGEKTPLVLQSFLSQALGVKSKNAGKNFDVCKAMVAAAFHGIIDTADLPERPEQGSILQTLTLFSRADPKLFTQQQLEHLQPYITNLSNTDDLNLFRSVVVILRCVIPTFSAMQKDFLKRIQDDLLRNITKLAKAELNEVVACLWTINGQLGNFEKLVTMEIGVLNKLHNGQLVDLADEKQQPELLRLKRLILLAGHFAKHCDFEPQSERFSLQLKWWAGTSVAECVVDSIKPFAAKHQPHGLRSVALDSIGMICQAWPNSFKRTDIASLFQQVLKSNEPDLQQIVLSSFRDFFAAQDQNVEARVSSGERDPLANGKLGGSMTASDSDEAAALIAQGFLKDILHIALSSQGMYSLTATEVVASITRQGHIHPKECGPALVALETSTNQRISDIAFQQHRNLHQQHESMFEKEYMRAIYEAYIYQRDVVKDLKGFTTHPYRAKLHLMYEVVKTSKNKFQSKFITRFSSKVNFDVTKIDLIAELPAHSLYAKFLIENLAFFEYGRVEDVMHAISCIEKIVAGTGAGIAHTINTEVFQVRLEPLADASNSVQEDYGLTNEVALKEVEPERLFQLCTASMILSMLWEARTFLRRLYGINATQQKRENKNKGSKDLSKAPTKTNGITGDKFVDNISRIARSVDSHELALTQCKEFADLLAIDTEVKVPADDDDGEDGRLQTPSVEDDGDSLMPPSGGSKATKRKGSLSIAGTPHKKRGRPPMNVRRKSNKSVDDEDETY
ncbi:Sister chromatid cohesion protein 2 [Lambiella insularis]|nr:Sister chromatid cohesion protein 2 [Lambiella insularis]